MRDRGSEYGCATSAYNEPDEMNGTGCVVGTVIDIDDDRQLTDATEIPHVTIDIPDLIRFDDVHMRCAETISDMRFTGYAECHD